MSVTANTVVALALAVTGLVAIVGLLAYRLGRAAGFDDGVKAVRRIDQSTPRGTPADRAT